MANLSRPISVVIPARNESGSITKVVHEALKCDLVDQVIVVDNQSNDDTSLLAAAAGAKVVTCDKVGFGATLKKGFSEAKTPWVFKIDADILNAKAEWIERFWGKTSGGFELISGQWEHDPIYWALSYFVIKPHIDLLLPGLSNIPLLNSGMYLVNRERISIDHFGDGWGFDTMIHIEFHLSGLPITICEIEPVKDYLRPQSQYFKTAADTIELFEKVRRDPRFLKGA